MRSFSGSALLSGDARISTAKRVRAIFQSPEIWNYWHDQARAAVETFRQEVPAPWVSAFVFRRQPWRGRIWTPLLRADRGLFKDPVNEAVAAFVRTVVLWSDFGSHVIAWERGLEEASHVLIPWNRQRFECGEAIMLPPVTIASDFPSGLN